MNHSCDICRVLGSLTDWGESIGGEPIPYDPPPEVARLIVVNEELLRCPICGNLYQRGHSSTPFLNNDYESDYVRRLRPDEYPASERDAATARARDDLLAEDTKVRRAAAQTLVRNEEFHPLLVDSKFSDVRSVIVANLSHRQLRNFATLRPGLESMLDDPSDDVRKFAAEVIIRNAPDTIDRFLQSDPELLAAALEWLGMFDVTPLEERLRKLSRHPDLPQIRRAAGKVLTRHLLKSNRRNEAVASLETSTGETLRGVVEGFQADSDPEVRELASRFLPPAPKTEIPLTGEAALMFVNLEAGHLMIGGGRAPEWHIYARDGQFFITHWFGDHGDEQPITAQRVRSILQRKGYTWQQTR